MRYTSIVAAAFGLLSAAEAHRLKHRHPANEPEPTTSVEIPDIETPVDYDSFPVDTEKPENYNLTGSVIWVQDDEVTGGEEAAKRGVFQLDAEGESDDETVDKRDITGTSVGTTLRGLTVNAQYTVQFRYLVLAAFPRDSCRIQASFDGKVFATTDRFPYTLISSRWATVSGVVTAGKTTGSVTVVVQCNRGGIARVYIDTITATKKASVTTTAKGTTTTGPATTITAEQPQTTTTTAPVTNPNTSSTSATVTDNVQTSTTSATSAAVTSSATSVVSSATSVASSVTSVVSESTSVTSSVISVVSETSVTSAVTSDTTSDASSTTSVASSTTSDSSSSSSASSIDTSATTDASSTVSSSSTSTSSSATSSSSAAASGTVDSTILVFAKDATTAKLGSDGLLAYGIPFEHVIVPQTGLELPVLNATLNKGNYGGFIILDSVSYDYGTTVGWRSAINDTQWNAIYEYQTRFGVRMVRINDYPGVGSGTLPIAGGCCDAAVTQSVFFSDVSAFASANVKVNAEVSTTGLYHVPASITDSATTKAVARFGPATGFADGGVAAVVNNFNGREQWVWFMSWAPSWSMTSAFLDHGHIHWLTRGVFIGKRKIHLNAQVDDVQLSTEMYYPTGIPEVKITVADLEAHVNWQKSLAQRLPTGSDFWLELGHNGNGDLINATQADTNAICIPDEAVYYDMPVQAPHEWKKPLGTGEDAWPVAFETYSWTQTCAELDVFAKWFTVAENLNQFAHISHTFTHLNLNNATFHDAKREIQFNQAWMKAMGIDKATRFSPKGLIPPQITGLYNGDSIQALTESGITNAVGDNTRPQTRNPNNVYWPLITTVDANGYAGLVVIPRFSSRIYFNCHTHECTLREWIATSAGSGDFANLLRLEKESGTRNLLALMSDPYMFHQANMFQSEVESITIGDQSGKMSLIMAWTETVLQELNRLTAWPVRSLTQDVLADYFVDRKTVDDCNPKMSLVRADDGKSITAVTVTANGNTCARPIPVTIPQGSSTAQGGSVTSDVVGSEPPIQWVTLNGSPVTLTLSSPITL